MNRLRRAGFLLLLLAIAGINREMVQEFISVFALWMGQFRSLIVDRCG